MNKDAHKLVARIAIREDQLDSNYQNMNDVAGTFTNLKLSEDTPVVYVNNTVNDGRAKSKSKSLRRNNNIPYNIVEELSESGITPLKKKSLKFPNASFYCHVCDYHCDTVAICRKHVNESRHLKSVDLLKQKATISVLPKPNVAQLEATTELIHSVATKYGMTEAKRKECGVLKGYIEGEIKKRFPDISLLMNGSCLSGFALEDSGLDLDLVICQEQTKKIGHIFEQVYKIVVDNKQFSNESKAFAASYPQVCFSHTASGIEVSIGIHNSVTVYTNELLSDYVSLDSRVRTLGVAFRYWAQLCEVDKFSEGSLAPRCFPLLVIYFLQRCKDPVLPCLHKDRNDTSYTKPNDMKPRWKTKNKSSVGSLWLDLLRFYAVGINFKHYLIDITSPHYLYRKTRKSIKMAIEEPLYHKNSGTGKKWLLSQSVSSNDVFYFIFASIRNTFFYFLVPQLHFGSMFCAIKDAEYLSKEPDNEANGQDKDTASVNDTVDGDVTEEANEPEIKTNCSSSSYYDIVSWPSYTVEEEAHLVQIDDLTTSFKSIEFRLALQLSRAVEPRHIFLRFHPDHFTRGESVPLRCSVCHMAGHAKQNCKEFDLPPLCPLPDSYTSTYDDVLGLTLAGVRNYYEPSSKEVSYRVGVLGNLQAFIQESYPTAILELFGSSTNGFGFSESDLDICLTFKDSPTDKDIDPIQIIKNLAQKLKTEERRDLEVREVMAITTAKVPIVKFLLPWSHLEVDISLYNTLALRNSNMLSIYTKIDNRVQIIGYAFKFLAKLCQIGDASRGSLSSYAYILLVIHYLQNCSPPVLPVLQELNKGKSKPEHIVDGWDTWFCEDLKNISKVWKGYKKNKMSIGQLWIGLLRYYTETFDWDLNVVSIRQIAPLSRLEKMWNTMCICIEDPFDLQHNLGGGLSRRMSTYIMKCFIRAREAFGASAIECTHQNQLIEFTFNTTILMDGFPPNDRGCRCCGKIGHIVKECPKKKQIEERKRDKKKRKEFMVANASADRKNAGQNSRQRISPEAATDSPVSLRATSMDSPVSLHPTVMDSPVNIRPTVMDSPVSLRATVMDSPVSLRATVMDSPVSLRATVMDSPVSLPATVVDSARLPKETAVPSLMFYATERVAENGPTKPLDIPAAVNSTSYSVGEFFKLVGSAGDMPNIQTKAGAVPTMPSPVGNGGTPKPRIVPPPGFASAVGVTPPGYSMAAPRHMTPVHSAVNYLPNAAPEQLQMHQPMAYGDPRRGVGQMDSRAAGNRTLPLELSSNLQTPFSNSYPAQASMPSALNVSDGSPLDINRRPMPVGSMMGKAAALGSYPSDVSVGGHMPVGYPNCLPDAMHRHAQQQMDAAWNMRPFAAAAGFTPSYGVSAGRSGPMPASNSVPPFSAAVQQQHQQYGRTNPELMAQRAPSLVDPVLQQMMMYGAAGGNGPVFSTADAVPPGFGSPSVYQMPMMNPQNFTPENMRQPIDRNRSFRQ